MQFTSPLRYPGGKGRLAEFMGRVMENNDLVGGQYAEVYAGGAGVAITLLLLDYAKVIHINDLNRSVHAFWRSVIEAPDALCQRIIDTTVDISEWERQRAVQIAEDPDPLDLGFSTFFLNRTNRSGILLGGVIGGKKQDGKWKLDARYNKADLVRRIQDIARHANRIRLYKLNASDFIERIIPMMPDKSFIYLDPPYRNKGRDLYQNNYRDSDHMEIANLIQDSIQKPWLVSYDNDPWIASLYSASSQITFDLYYSAGPRYKGKEFIAYSPSIVLPSNITPRRACRE